MKKTITFSIFLLAACSQSQTGVDYAVKSQHCDACFATELALPESTGDMLVSHATPIQSSTAKTDKLMLIDIVNLSLEYNRSNSSLPSVVEQRKAESEVIYRNNWPTIQPVARYSSQTNPYIGLGAGYTIWDFGSSSQKERQGELNITASQIDFLIEERMVIATTLEALSKIAALIESRNLLEKSIGDIQRLSRFADIRLQAGISSLSESNMLNLRLAELQSELDSLNVEINLGINLLSAKLSHPITELQIPTLAKMQSEVLADLGDTPLQLQQAKINKDLAYSQWEQAKSDTYPHLAIEGEVGRSTTGRSVKSVGLVLKTPTSIFSSKASARAAESAYAAKNKVVTQLEQQSDAENKRIVLETERLNNNHKTLAQLESNSVRAVQIFNEEYEVNNSSLSDGLSAYRTLLQTKQQIVGVKAELLNLKASKIRITSGKIFKDK